jgi:uncharacterized protein YgiB involved in biofilm formation
VRSFIFWEKPMGKCIEKFQTLRAQRENGRKKTSSNTNTIIRKKESVTYTDGGFDRSWSENYISSSDFKYKQILFYQIY